MADSTDSLHRQWQADAAGDAVFPMDIPADWAGDQQAGADSRLLDRTDYAPGSEGGANYGPLAYSLQPLLYVNAIDGPRNSGRPARATCRPSTPDG